MFGPSEIDVADTGKSIGYSDSVFLKNGFFLLLVCKDVRYSLL